MHCQKVKLRSLSGSLFSEVALHPSLGVSHMMLRSRALRFSDMPMQHLLAIGAVPSDLYIRG